MTKSQVQPLGLARTIRTRTLIAVLALGGVMGGLIVFASVQVSRGSPPPRGLMAVTAMPTVVMPPSPVEMKVVPAIVPEVIEPEPAMPQAAWQTMGDPPLPDHDPWAEMQHAPASTSGGTGPSFDGRRLRKARTVRMLVTAYSPDEKSCGIHADGITASGYSVYTNGMKLVAADTKLLPFGSVVTIPGYNSGKPVPVLDRGGKIKGRRLDVLYPTHQRALQWGAQWLEVTVWEYAD